MTKLRLNKYGILLFLTGFAALTYEIIFLKTLSLFLGQSIYAFSVMLASFMFGIGIGSYIGSNLKGEPLWLFALTQLGIAAFSILYIPLLNSISVPAFIVARLPFYLQNAGMILLAMLVLLIPTSLMGLSFPVLLRHVVEEKNDKKQIGQLFAYNTLGGLFGSLAAGFIFLPEFGVPSSLLIAALINLTVVLVLKTKHLLGRMAAAALLLIVAFAADLKVDIHSIGSFYNAESYTSVQEFQEHIEASKKETTVLFSDYDVYGHVCVFQSGTSKFLFINGKPDASTSQDITTQLLIGYIPMLLHETPDKVAIVGLGCGLTARAVQEVGMEQLDIYEINPAVIAANKHFIEESNRVLQNPKTSLIVGDARRNLSLSDEVYDVLISEPSNPWVEGEGFLFTKEYYDIIDKRLSDDGIFVQWIGSYDYTAEAFDILLNTLHLKFPHIQLWSDGTDFYIITSKQPKRFNYTKTHGYINKPVIKADMKLIGFLDNKKLNPIDIFFSYFIAHYEETGESRINTDDNSIIEFSTGRFTGESVNHAKRFINDQIKIFPADMGKNDLDIEFETDLPLQESNYSFIQVGKNTVISKQLAFRNQTRALFVQTTTQPVKPTLEQARALARSFNAEAAESKDHLYDLKGKNSSGVIGYCPDNQLTYLLFATTNKQIMVKCKPTSEEL